jgi:hypothetical protein
MPPAPQPKKKSKTWLWIVAILIALFVGYAAGGSGKSTTATNDTTTVAQPTQSGSQGQNKAAPTKAPTKKWTTVQTFTGNGAKKTETFTVGDHWRFSWECQGVSGIDAPLYISVYKSDGNMLDLNAASTTCKASGPKTTGNSEMHQGGEVYLDVNSGIDWKITVEEMK